MSEHAAAIAAATGVPEELVMRSARARAQATGVAVDSVLEAWSGGGALPAAATAGTAAPATVESAAAPEPPAGSAEPTPADQTPTAAQTAPAPPEAPSAPPGRPLADPRKTAAPLLEGRRESAPALLFALLGLFFLGVIFAVVLPAADARQVASEQIPGSTPVLSDQALDGRAVYLREGCATCHTQQVRSVVTDVGLGQVTEPGTTPAEATDTYGHRRIGPDLAHVGSREPTNDPAWLQTFLTTPRTVHEGSLQPSYAHLSDEDLAALVQYLVESR